MKVGASVDAIDAVCRDIGVDPDTELSILQMTEVVLLELRLAARAKVDVVVFSTAGLDPKGIRAIAGDVRELLKQSAVVAVFATALREQNERICDFDSVYWCLEYGASVL
jgi:hypothetical protein